MTSVLLKKRKSYMKKGCTSFANGSARIKWPAALATLLFADVFAGYGGIRYTIANDGGINAGGFVIVVGAGMRLPF